MDKSPPKRPIIKRPASYKRQTTQKKRPFLKKRPVRVNRLTEEERDRLITKYKDEQNRFESEKKEKNSLRITPKLPPKQSVSSKRRFTPLIRNNSSAFKKQYRRIMRNESLRQKKEKKIHKVKPERSRKNISEKLFEETERMMMGHENKPIPYQPRSKRSLSKWSGFTPFRSKRNNSSAFKKQYRRIMRNESLRQKKENKIPRSKRSLSQWFKRILS